MFSIPGVFISSTRRSQRPRRAPDDWGRLPESAMDTQVARIVLEGTYVPPATLYEPCTG